MVRILRFAVTLMNQERSSLLILRFVWDEFCGEKFEVLALVSAKLLLPSSARGVLWTVFYER